LGDWIRLPDDWKCFFAIDTDTLYEKESEDSWRVWNRNQGRRPTRMQGFRRSLQWRSARPVHSKPTTVTAGTVKRIKGTKPSRTLLPEAAQKWWYEMVEPTEHIESLAQGFRAGTAIWVTDGSYKAPYGSAAFILKPSLDSEISIKIVNQTPGRSEHGCVPR
jgi:hypothetical protein